MTVQPAALNLPAVVTGGSMQPGLAVLGEWLMAADSASRLATQLISSFFVPEAYKPRPQGNSAEARQEAYGVAVANATGAILLGQSLGLDPLTSLQQIYVVHGRPGMYAKMKVALAQASGHRVWDEVCSADRAVVCGQRKGTEDVVRVEITMAMAKSAGWTSNAAYAKTPADMLWARAASRVVDRIAADALFGIRSIEDIDADEQEPVQARVDVEEVKRRAPQVRALTAEPVVPVEPVTPIAAALTDQQWVKVNAALKDAGVTGAGQVNRRLCAITRIVGREIAKGSDLTATEGDNLIARLEEMPDQAIRDLADGLDITAPAEPTAATYEPSGLDEFDPTTDAKWAGEQG